MIEIVSSGRAGGRVSRPGARITRTAAEAPDASLEPVNRNGVAHERDHRTRHPARRKLRDIQVHFLSLVPAAANQRTVLVKSAARSGCVVLEKELRIDKADPARHIVYGIVYAPDETDTEGDTASAEEIRRAAYTFMQEGRTGQIDSDHDGEAGKGYVAESWIVRPGDPLFPDEPPGTWAVGVKVTDPATWQRIERGELRGISMAGLARPEPLPLASSAHPDTQEPEDENATGGIGGLLRKMLRLDLTGASTHPAEPIHDLEEAVARRDAMLADMIHRTEQLTRRLDAFERHTRGRQTVLGGDSRPVHKGKGFKGINII